MAKDYILVIGSVPSRLYSLVRFEVRKRTRREHPQVLRLDFTSLVDTCGDVAGVLPKTLTKLQVQTACPDFSPGQVRAIVAEIPPFEDNLENFLKCFWSNEIGTTVPYYELEVLEAGRKALVGRGLGRTTFTTK